MFSGFLSSKTTLRFIHVVACMSACSVAQLYSILCNPMDGSPPDFSVHGILAGKNTGAVYHFLLQGIFQTQRSTHVFCISRQIPYHWAAWEAPCINCLSLHIALPWFVFPFTSWRTCVVVFFFVLFLSFWLSETKLLWAICTHLCVDVCFQFLYLRVKCLGYVIAQICLTF